MSMLAPPDVLDAAAATTMMATPPLPPELWNFAVIVVICGLVAWLMRITQLFLTFVDVRFAVQSNAVLHLKDLGPSLPVLENATVWHFEQLSRTKVQVTSVKMASVRIPFEIPSASLAVSRAVMSDAAAAGQCDPPMCLSFKVRTHVKCVVQVLWGVKVDALLEHSHRLASAQSLASPRLATRSEHIPVLQRLSSPKKSMRQRAAELPTFLSRTRRQNRRHRLTEDKDSDEQDACGQVDSSAGLSLEHLMSEESYRSASPSERFDTWGEHEFAAEIPRSSTVGPTEEIRSLLAEVESDVPTNAAPRELAALDQEPRYSAVVLVGALEFFNESLSAKQLARDDNAVVCQCVAIDFLPTPVRAEKFTPVVVKRFTVTLTGVYVQQEIFGRGEAAAGECVICLEGELAVVLLPCRHLCVCRACLREINQCPICRAKFTTYACFIEEEEEEKSRCVDAKAGGAVELKIV